MAVVGLDRRLSERFPVNSGGQKQKVVLLERLALNHRYYYVMEPTANLAVTVQVHILDLLKELQRKN